VLPPDVYPASSVSHVADVEDQVCLKLGGEMGPEDPVDHNPTGGALKHGGASRFHTPNGGKGSIGDNSRWHGPTLRRTNMFIPVASAIVG
jgi:hypothetical protein